MEELDLSIKPHLVVSAGKFAKTKSLPKNFGLFGVFGLTFTTAFDTIALLIHGEPIAKHSIFNTHKRCSMLF